MEEDFGVGGSGMDSLRVRFFSRPEEAFVYVHAFIIVGVAIFRSCLELE